MSKVYERWPGSQRFHCGGRCVSARESGAFYATLALVLVPAALTAYFVCVPLALVSWAFLACALLLDVLVLLALLSTSLSDPGYLPRALASEPNVNAQSQDAHSNHYGDLESPPEPSVPSVPSDAPWPSARWCAKCSQWRPSPSHHCKECDTCVLEFDHHCPWVGNCIGYRNYRSFLWFIAAVIAASAFNLACSALLLTRLIRGHTSLTSPASLGPLLAPSLLGLYSLVIGLSVGSLAVFHCGLLAKGRTTFEQLTRSRRRRGVKARARCSRICCSPIPAPHVDFTSPSAEYGPLIAEPSNAEDETNELLTGDKDPKPEKTLRDEKEFSESDSD